MVTYLFRLTDLGGVFARVARGTTTSPSPNSPCGAARDLLLHHHRLVKLAVGETPLLGHTGDHY